MSAAWSYIIDIDQETIEDKHTYHNSNHTSQSMEVKAFTELLNRLIMLMKNKEIGNVMSRDIVIYMDSMYVFKGTTEWMDNWYKANWKVGKGDRTHAQDWIQIHSAVQWLKKNKKSVFLNWVRGHTDNAMNIRADKLCSDR
jgi:ribonuclease HI